MIRSRNQVEIKKNFYEEIDLLIDAKEIESAEKIYRWKFSERIHQRVTIINKLLYIVCIKERQEVTIMRWLQRVE